jgi:DNA-binding PadR family transcriptional regulator
MERLDSNRIASENNRKAKFYSITKAGRKQLSAEEENWHRRVIELHQSSRQLESEVQVLAEESVRIVLLHQAQI